MTCLSKFHPKLIKVCWKFGPKSVQNLIQNQFKFKLISIQNPSKFCVNLVQNRSWGVLGAIFGKITKNDSGALTIWSLLGAKLAGLGAQDGATDGQVGGTWGPKWRQQGQNNRSQNRSFFGCLLKSIFSDFGGFWEPKWRQVGTKIGWRINVNLKKPTFLKIL